MDDFCIVIQGPSNHVNIIKDRLKECNVQLIYSTWREDGNKYENSDIVVLSDPPESNGVGNINLQMTTTINGLLEAKRLGFKRALKLRSDMIPTNPIDFIKLFDNDNLTFFSWHYSQQGSISGYMVDYLMSGPIDDLIKIWSIETKNHSVAEVLMTANIVKYFKDNKMSFILDNLNSENDVYWIKYNCYLSTYKTINSGSHFGSINLITNDEYNKFFNI